MAAPSLNSPPPLVPAKFAGLAAIAVPALVWASSSLPFPFSVLASLLAVGAAYLAGKPISPPRWLAGKPLVPLALVPIAGSVSAALFSYSLTLSGWYALAAMAGAVVLAAVAGLSEPQPLVTRPAQSAAEDEIRALGAAAHANKLARAAIANTLVTSTASLADECSLGDAGKGKCQ